MSNYNCKIPFCTNLKTNTSLSLYCRPHLNEMARIKGGIYKEPIPIEYIMRCKKHGLLNEDEVYLQKTPIRKKTLSHSFNKICRYCVRERQNSYRAKDIKKETLRRKKNMLKNKFNLTLEEFNAMVKLQNNACAICNKIETAIDPRTKSTRNLAVDHCHKTGTVRGLLCSNCNSGLGQFKDSPQLLERAIEYLNCT